MRTANVSAGEIGITMDGRHFVFRPSFYAMQKIGTDEELIESFDRIKRGGFGAILRAHTILEACCTSGDDIDSIIGYFRPVNDRIRYVQKSMPVEDLLVLALVLVRNGVCGTEKYAGYPSQERIGKTFSVKEYVGQISAMLEIVPSEAFEMTMTEFQLHVNAKIPEGEKRPTDTEYDTMMSMSKDINEKMNARMSHG